MKKAQYLDREEQQLIESLESNNWKSARDIEGWKTRLSKTATVSNIGCQRHS